MTPDQLRQLATDSRFIPGVYNYCDRWCERCPLAHRCLNFATEQAGGGADPVTRDLDNQKFWEQVQASFQSTLQMLQEEVQRRGGDLNVSETEVAAAAQARRVRRQAARHQPLGQAARDYGFAVRDWFEQGKALFQTKGVELEEQARLGIGQPAQEAEQIQELLEVIRWYHLFIHVKLARAISAQAEEQLETDPELKPLLRDGDGSAKIALIAIDRSLTAWTALRAYFPDQEDAILNFQVQLARIRQEAEKTFPKARAFIRPGFDEDLGRLERGQGA